MLRDRRVAPAALWALVLVLAGCGVGVNEDLLATSTPYPVRSPVVGGLGSATPDAEVAEAVATGEAALAAGRVDRALAAFNRAVAASPRDADALLGRAMARSRTGDPAGATSDLDTAVAAAPERADLYLARGRLAEWDADFAVAVADYGRAIARDPGDPAAYVARALAIVATAYGDAAAYQAAGNDLTRALTIDPNHLPALLGRARIGLDRATFGGDPADLDRALADLDALGPAADEPAALLLRARVLAARGDQDGAREALGRVEETAAGTPAAGAVDPAALDLVRAEVAAEAGEWGAAAEAALASLDADLARWEAYRLLAEAELGRGNAEAALAATDRLLAAAPDDGPGLYLRGVALVALGRAEEARAALTAAQARMPDSPVYRARITQALSGLA